LLGAVALGYPCNELIVNRVFMEAGKINYQEMVFRTEKRKIMAMVELKKGHTILPMMYFFKYKKD
jgi:hypothetical protein